MGWTFYFWVIFLITVFEPVAPFTVSPEQTLSVNELKNDNDYSSYRLPKEIVPISYDLWIYTRLGLNDFAYQGCVNITLKILEAIDTIVVHNDGLIIHEGETSLRQRREETLDSINFPVGDQSHDSQRQFHILNFQTKLEPGVYVLGLHFEGEVRNDVFGFYRSSYVENGETKWMGVTQFSPTYARRAFPCMDEPHLKAFFTLHVGHVGNQMVTSNTAIETTTKDSHQTNYYVTTFLTTPRMSTYLVGWAVHDFAAETSVSSKNFKMWTRGSMNRRASIALNQGVPIYSFLNGWFGIDNPIPKMDQIAVADFNFHAMENWGMITYRETVVLFEDGVTPTKYMFDGFTTMAHEYAHTWFGNLVTPMFWNVAWLKEGFASYFQYFAVSSVQPSWKVMDKFAVDILQPTLVLDSTNHTRVMNGRNVGSPSSIMDVLDFVSYKKGASVIRMVSHVIGEPAFKNGLQSYLRNMSYQAASPLDLYEYLQRSSDKLGQLRNDIVIKDIMESWTDQPGFPLVTVTRNYKQQILNVSQERFFQNRSECIKDHKTPRWWIPLNFVTKSSLADFSHTAAKEWLRPEDKMLVINISLSSEDWVIFNVQQIGYYRVNYDERNWRMLIDYLRSGDFIKIHKGNRAALLDDAFNLARAGYVDYSIPFNLSSYLVQEFDYEPWVSAVNNFKFLNKMLSSVPDVQRDFQKYVRRLLEPIYKRLSFNQSPHDDLVAKLHREIILSTSCSMCNPDCLRKSEILFQKWILAPDEPILQDVKSFVYCEGIRNVDEKDWYRTLGRWLLFTDLLTEQELLLQALACTRKANLINKYLMLSISDEENIRKQYRIAIVNSVLEASATNVKYVLEFTRHNFQKIIDSRGYDFLSKVISAIGSAVTEEEQIEQLRSFVDEKFEDLGAALSAAKKAIIVSTANMEWVKKYSSSIARCFR
ncbi:aminopeptidase N-like [Hylaeus anthracinus]|uniref:aminopeptidase N-like n=1 Tax=Hylaeus anthracinus TaxID=313031 RepID=UPI0023BA2A6D|nr:aminopeptidase N-like [Hylaeus anthracinus]